MKATGNRESQENSIDYSVSFSGIDKKIISDNFTGGKIDIKFGGVRVDLSEAKIKNKGSVTLEINVMGGGLQIIVPPTWLIQESLKHTAGGFHDTTTPPKGKPEGTLIIKAAITFGGVEISNEK